MTQISKPKEIAFSVFLLVVSLLLCFLVSETYLTIQYNKEQHRILSKSRFKYLCTTRSESPELMYTRAPGTCGNNSHGFRGTEHSYKKDVGVFRIVIIGDSVAEGARIKFKNSFGKILETKLNKALAGKEKKVEVIVLAVSGYSTSQELYLAENQAFTYSPDLVVWSYVLNDPAHPVYHHSNGTLGQYYFKPRIHTVHFVYKKLFQIREKYKMDGCARGYYWMLHCVYWEQVAASVRKISELSKTNATPIVFLIHPIIEAYENYSLSTVHEKLGEIASESGLPILDLLNAYSIYNPEELSVARKAQIDMIHPNEKGHRITADALFDFIIQRDDFQKWIDERRR